MATYNGARFLRAQLDSLASQELRPAELVVCDDGSTDDTLAILNDFAAAAPFPVRIRANPRNLGWRANFMQAAGLCRAALIAFCDQDDLWYPRKLSTMASLLTDPAVLLAHHDADLIDAAGAVRGRLRAHDRDVALRPPLTRPVHWESPLGLTLVFRRLLLAFSAYWPFSMDPAKPTGPAAHDQWFFTLASCFGKVAFAPDLLLGYRQHGANAVGFDPDTRSGLGRDPARVAARLAGEAAMVAALCAVLDRMERDDRLPLREHVPAALARCRRLHDRLALRAQVRIGPAFAKRTGALVRLIGGGSYGGLDPWRFGYSDLIGDAAAVLVASARTA